MSAPVSNRLTKLLTATGLFTPEQIEELVVQQRDNDSVLTALVVAQGYAREDVFLTELAKAMKVPYVRVGNETIPGEILEKVPTKAVFQYNVIPLGVEDGVLRVATSEPFRPGLADALRLASGLRVRFALAPAAEIEKAAKKFYGVGADTLDRLRADNQLDLDDGTGSLIGDLSNLDQEASVVKFVNQIIWEAHHDRGTDIHIEPMETDLRIRYRIDGVLHPTPLPPQMKRFQSAIISRIKVMAGMDIAEKRLPQDGRISLRIKGEEIDVRVSTMPTVYGESVSLRLLMRSSGMFGMDKLGLLKDDEAILNRLIRKPHGILLVTGPTGSANPPASTPGSTPSIPWTSAFSRWKTIEYEMAGINQIQMRPEIGLTLPGCGTFCAKTPTSSWL